MSKKDQSVQTTELELIEVIHRYEIVYLEDYYCIFKALFEQINENEKLKNIVIEFCENQE